MRRSILAIALLCILPTAQAENVTIDRKELSPTLCTTPYPMVVKNEDGTYSRPNVSSTLSLTLCFQEVKWKEEWSALPEKGGKFVKVIPPPEEKKK